MSSGSCVGGACEPGGQQSRWAGAAGFWHRDCSGCSERERRGESRDRAPGPDDIPGLAGQEGPGGVLEDADYVIGYVANRCN